MIYPKANMIFLKAIHTRQLKVLCLKVLTSDDMAVFVSKYVPTLTNSHASYIAAVGTIYHLIVESILTCRNDVGKRVILDLPYY